MVDFNHRNKSWMTADLFREGDIVTPTFGDLAGVRGVVAYVGVYVTIEFPRRIKKYPREPSSQAKHKWNYEPSNVRLLAYRRCRSRHEKT